MRNYVVPLLVAAAVLFPGAGVSAEPLPPRIVVIGEGEATALPDLALISFSVMREAETARAALDANNAAMAAVIAAMKSSGIEDRDLQTAGIQINPRYTYTNKPDGTQEGRLTGYQVVNTLSLRLRDIDKAGEILDEAVSLGVNQGGSIAFTNDDTAAVMNEARRRAVADAMAKAKLLAEAAGVTLGRVVEISDMAAPAPLPYQAKAFDSREAAAAVPVEAGETAYSVQVNMTFELK